ncbi:MAG: archease [Candidatus Nealsonbacteria bacterium]|nr:archease [Candidatus Nealsonbacteria bacterium]
MKKYEILPHAADLQIKVFGKTKEELFLNALFAMGEQQQAQPAKEAVIERDIEIKSIDSEALLVDFLSEALYLSQVNKESYFDAKFDKFSDTGLSGKIFGRKAKSFGEDIKAVTFHRLKIEKKSGIFETLIVFDI